MKHLGLLCFQTQWSQMSEVPKLPLARIAIKTWMALRTTFVFFITAVPGRQGLPGYCYPITVHHVCRRGALKKWGLNMTQFLRWNSRSKWINRWVVISVESYHQRLGDWDSKPLGPKPKPPGKKKTHLGWVLHFHNFIADQRDRVP